MKCCRAPRVSQIPSSGSRQIVSTCSTTVRQRGQNRCSILPSASSADERDAHHLAVHVELELLRRSVTDPNRLGALVAGQLVELELGQPAFAADPVHDLDLRRVARADPKEKVAEAERLLGVPGRQQRLQREHRVAQPAVAVIPVAHPADVLRQRCRRRCDHRTSRLIGHRLERDQRGQHLLPIRALVGAAPAPLPPPRLGSCERRVGILHRRGLLVGQMPGQHEALASSLDRDELGTDRAVLRPRQRQRSAEPKRVRPGRNHDPVRGQLNPRHDRPVVRTQRKLHPHRHPTPQALHDPHQPRRPVAPPGHEVDHPHRAVWGLEIAL